MVIKDKKDRLSRYLRAIENGTTEQFHDKRDLSYHEYTKKYHPYD